MLLCLLLAFVSEISGPNDLGDQHLKYLGDFHHVDVVVLSSSMVGGEQEGQEVHVNHNAYLIKEKKHHRAVILHHRDDGGGNGIGGHFEAVLLKTKNQPEADFQGVFDHPNAFIQELLGNGLNNKVRTQEEEVDEYSADSGGVEGDIDVEEWDMSSHNAEEHDPDEQDTQCQEASPVEDELEDCA